MILLVTTDYHILLHTTCHRPHKGMRATVTDRCPGRHLADRLLLTTYYLLLTTYYFCLPFTAPFLLLAKACELQCQTAALAATSPMTALPSDKFLARQYKAMMEAERAYDGRIEWPQMIRRLNRKGSDYAR